jgi:DNA-directed RNA polymerase subunit RPC12/RpoP
MGIKCSLFGHAFGETTVERDREEQGSEVVSTIRELQTCTRCGERRVVSENKEVTTLETPTDNASPAPTIADAEATAEADDEAVETAAPPAAETGDEDAEDSADDELVDEEPPVTDDAEILDGEDEGDEPDREPGQWPQEADEGEDEPTDEDFNQFGYDDTEETVDEEKTDAEFIDSEDEPEESTPQPQTNEWPSEEEIDAAGEPETAGPGAVTVPEGSFVCEGCGFSTPVESSSLREGDFCPECHKETLVQVRDNP